MKSHSRHLISDASQIGELRRLVTGWAQEEAFDETMVGQIAIVINELCTNLLKHATSGEVICSIYSKKIEIISIDKGPGMANASDCLKDGYSTQGTQGNGLGAVKRLATSFDIFTQLGKGTIIYAGFWMPRPRYPEIEYSVINLPIKGEVVSGDAWSVSKRSNGEYKFMVADGLGHGLLAHQAALAAVKVFEENESLNSQEDLNLIHLGLRGTRGAAVAVAHQSLKKELIDYCGLGNINSGIVSYSINKRLISFNGIAGIQLLKLQAYSYPTDENSLLIMHSDGMGTHWNIADYPGLLIRHPAIIAGLLYRDYCRHSDDFTVLVSRKTE